MEAVAPGARVFEARAFLGLSQKAARAAQALQLETPQEAEEVGAEPPRWARVSADAAPIKFGRDVAGAEPVWRGWVRFATEDAQVRPQRIEAA